MENLPEVSEPKKRRSLFKIDADEAPAKETIKSVKDQAKLCDYEATLKAEQEHFVSSIYCTRKEYLNFKQQLRDKDKGNIQLTDSQSDIIHGLNLTHKQQQARLRIAAKYLNIQIEHNKQKKAEMDKILQLADMHIQENLKKITGK